MHLYAERTHLEYVETSVRLGKDALFEKPMAASVERASRMVDLCDENDVTLIIAYRMQTEPTVRRAKELVQDGVIGDPILDICPTPCLTSFPTWTSSALTPSYSSSQKFLLVCCPQQKEDH